MELTSRRSLLAAAAALPAIAATPVVAEEISRGEAWRLKKRAFIEKISSIHTRSCEQYGRYVATKAMAMDLDPDELTLVQFVDPAHAERMPALHFRKTGAPHITVVVHRLGAYEHGPVL